MTPVAALDASTILSAYDAVRPLAREPLAPPADVDAARRLQDDVNALRRARGERPMGRKIGFTNRSIWPLYGVHQPIWAPVWDSTLTLLDGTTADIDLNRFVEPRLEPEIVLHLARTPASADLADVAAAIDWVAHGFEIVQSPWPGWKFTAAESIAAQSLHGALLVGPRVPMSAAVDAAALSGLRLALDCDGRRVAEGTGALVLDGPVQALCHLVAELARHGQSLQPGEVITTGTLTDAQPLHAGQAWRSSIEGAPLSGLVLRTR